MIEYPDDVMKDAREVANRVQREWKEFHAPTTKEVRLVAAALLAERARCTGIVRKVAADYDSIAYAGLPPAFSLVAEHMISDIDGKPE